MNILGISGVFNHDAAACIISDGKLIAMVEEERIIRKKRAFKSLPIESAKYCLYQAGLRPEEIDILAVGWDPALFCGSKYNSQYIDKFIGNECWSGKLKPEIAYIPHHIAHAASSYYISNIESGIVLVIDGHGENASTSIGFCENGKIKIEQSFPIAYSLGHFYETVSSFLGLGKNSSGKLMGLASYGVENHYFDEVIKHSGIDYNIQLMDENLNLDFRETTLKWNQYLSAKFGNEFGLEYSWDYVNSTSLYSIKEFKRASNIAASAQHILEETIIGIIREAFVKYNTRNLLLAGGVALNCSMNGKIIKAISPNNFFVCPASNDAGTALGAACYVLGTKIKNKFTPYLGPGINKNGVYTLLKKCNLKFRISYDIAEEVSEFVSNKKTIGFVQGREEVGPRALGNRSIIALPIDANMRDRINEIKCREKWRPLSPSIIFENSEILFGKSVYSKYMLEAHCVESSSRKNIGGAVHVDNTCRPQVLQRDDNPVYYDIIKKVYEKTGVLAIMNTSFNDAFEPMILNAKDAIRTFMASPLDVLVIENFIIEK